MSSVESIALLFQRIFLSAPLLLTIGQLIGGWHLAKSQAIVKKVKVQRCLLVDAVAVVCHQTSQFVNVWEMVEHAITLLTFQLVQLNSLVFQIEVIKIYALLLVFLELLAVFEETSNRKDSTGD